MLNVALLNYKRADALTLTVTSPDIRNVKPE